MPQCSFSSESAMMNVTPVQNIFLIEYLPKAPENYAKVYLYGLMQCYCPALGGVDMAFALGLSEQQVVEAFLYWQTQGLVRIAQDEPLCVEYSGLSSGATVAVGGARRYGALVSALQNVIGARVLTPAELSKIYDWVEVYGFDEAAAVLLVQYAISQKGPRVKIQYIDKIARSWANEGVLSADDATRRIEFERELQSGAQAILRRWRKSRLATEDELELYQKWTREWRLSLEDILAACAALTAAEKPTFAYLDAVLQNAKLSGGTQEYARRQSAIGDLATQAFERAGIPRKATATQRMQLETWVYTWHMPPELILLAAEYAAASSKQFHDMDRRITLWHDNGVTVVSAARAFERQPKPSGPPATKPRALNYSQRAYSADDFKSIGIKLLDDEDIE
ncbi:MAG: DnaD domain protein [Christensenellaceae bacterium]|jgi:DNA replication protein DnaD|nr:DnaD domain protein [Christensenellaceae bacterium]